MRAALTRGSGAALMRALLDAPGGLTTSQAAAITHYAQNTMNQAANLAAYDNLIYPAATAPGPGSPTVWAITPDHRADILAALTPQDSR